MRVIIACGGTGGHIYPGIALAEKLVSKYKAKVAFIGTRERMEADIIPDDGYEFFSIRISGFNRTLSPKFWGRNVANLINLAT